MIDTEMALWAVGGGESSGDISWEAMAPYNWGCCVSREAVFSRPPFPSYVHLRRICGANVDRGSWY